jgi:hypothetical protein
MQEVTPFECRASSALAIVWESVLLVFVVACGVVAVRQPSFVLPLLLCIGIGIFIFIWLRRFQIEVSRGTIRYSSLWNGGRSLAIADVGRAEVEVGLLKYGDRFRPPIRLVLHPKDAASGKPIVINTKVFRKEDIRRLLAILEEQGLLTG